MTVSDHIWFTGACFVIILSFKTIGKPLDEKKAMVLERNFSMMCEEMLEVPLLPYLISAGVMSLKMQRYVLHPKTHDQRICRLLDILKTRENGFDALLCAIDLSDQSHVSALLKCEFCKKNIIKRVTKYTK